MSKEKKAKVAGKDFKKDPLKEAMAQLEEYEEGTPPREHESCCSHHKSEEE